MDNTDNILGIEKVGIKTAEKWLDAWEDSEDVEAKILSKYIEKYGKVEGIARFGETFSLVYILKNDKDMIREIGYIPEVPVINEIIESEEESWEDKL